MREVKKESKMLKIKLICLVLIAIFTSVGLMNVFAIDLEVRKGTDIKNLVGSIVKTYSAGHTITQSEFDAEIKDRPFTALTTKWAIYCMEEGGRLFDNPHGTLDTMHPLGSINMGNEISFEYGGSPSFIRSGGKYRDYRERGENFTRESESNISFEKPSKAYTLSTTEAYAVSFNGFTSVCISEAGENNPWHNNSQFAVWKHNNTLYKAGQSVEVLQSEIAARGESPKVTAKRKDADMGCGTILEGDKYKVGPFEMSDYAYVGSKHVVGYSGSDVEKKDTVGGIVDGHITLNNGTTISFDDIEIVYEDEGDSTRGDGNIWGPPSDYKYPWPNSEFYIKIDRAACGDATTLHSFTFKFRKTETSGSGWYARGQYVLTTFDMQDATKSSCTYNCSNHSPSYARHTMGLPDGGTQTCTYEWTCYDHNEGCGCRGDHFICRSRDPAHVHNRGCYGSMPNCKCNCRGHRATHTSTFKCPAHEHEHCEQFNWTGDMKVMDAQPLMGAQQAKTIIDENEIESIVDVRLTTHLTINKYIIKAEHVGEAGVIFGESEERSRIDMPNPNTKSSPNQVEEKDQDPVPVERGDKITYKIDIINHQDQDVSFQIKDVLPGEIEEETFDPTIDDWLEVKANEIFTIEVTLRTTADSGKWENQAEIITRNSGDVDYNRTDYDPSDERHNGPVVNIAELEDGILKDSDFYIIKQYNINIDKYISDVTHYDGSRTVTNSTFQTFSDSDDTSSDVTSSTKRARDTIGSNAETEKEEKPAYVEVGDIVTYKIVVYNTVEKSVSNELGVDDRKADPYYEPDKVYVDIEDILPNCDPDKAEIEVDDVSGAGSDIYGISKGSTIKITDLMVPAGGKRVITLKIKAKDFDKTKKEVNTAKLLDEIRNINRGPDATPKDDSKFWAVKNNPIQTESRDWYMFKQYNVNIDKYISDVTHYDGSRTVTNSTFQTFSDSDDTSSDVTSSTKRARDTIGSSAESEKEQRPAYVEVGDIVTYKLVVYNTVEKSVSNELGVDDRKVEPYFEPDRVYVDIEDELPNCDPDKAEIEIEDISEAGSDIYGISKGSTIKITDLMVPAGGKRVITIKIKAKDYDKTKKEVNTAKILKEIKNINRGPDATPLDDSSYWTAENSPIQDESRDWYMFKQYSISLEKYITDVEHKPDFLFAGDNLDTTLDKTDARSWASLGSNAESIKENTPVYVEFGDKVTYKIVVYNTVENDVSNEFSVDRKNEPYFETDKVYVNLKDYFPERISNPTVEIEAGREGSYTIDESSGTFEVKDLEIPAGGTTTITVTLIVEEVEKGKKEENTIKFIDGIRNINKNAEYGDDAHCLVEQYQNNDDRHSVISVDENKYGNNSKNKYSCDWYILSDYNAFIDKYVYKYNEEMQKENNTNGYSNGGFITNDDATLKTSRERKPDGEKQEKPVSVEKYETLVYAIKVINEAEGTDKATASGDKYKTQVRPTKVTDYMQIGLLQEGLEAKLYNADGTEKRPVDVKSSGPSVDGKYNVYEYTIGNETILNPGEFIVYYVTATVTQSNMYLYNLENKAELTILTNINNTDEEPREVKNLEYNQNISEQQVSSDFVRLKDLVIAGNVWLDLNRDGYMNDEARSGETDIEYYILDDKKYYQVNDKAMKVDGITVKLYRADAEDTPIRTTTTNDQGLYVFGKEESLSWRQEDYNHDSPEVLEGSYDPGESTNSKYQRVDKATVKDSHGNYTAGSRYIEYYIEFEYDGVLYKSTEFYSGADNIVLEENSDFGKYDRSRPYGELNPPSTELHQTYKNSNPYLYEIDSNAAEFKDVREEFNRKYEYISYDSSYSDPGGSTVTSNMEYYKTGHISQLKEDEQRKMTARSFIKNPTIGEDPKIVEKDWFDPVFKDKSLENTNLLWLCKKGEPGDAFEPETEYLKHVNLGLELREDVDLALTKDVYKVKTTIDGEEMEYDFNQNTLLNGELGEGEKDGYLSDFIIAKPYGLELYESDYKYRFDQYKSQAVREYKGLQGESELNVEVIYRITVENKSVSDDDTMKDEGKEPPVKDTKLYARVHEILDLYDENFMKIQCDGSGNMIVPGGKGSPNTVTVKTKDENGFLVDKTLAIAEAWYFKEGDGEEKYIIENKEEVDAGKAKPIYKKDSNGTYIKVPLTMSNKPKFSDKKYNNNNFTADGYNTSYITGMEDAVIGEGENLDIYVKYTLDKTQLEIDITNENYEETETKTEETRIDSLTVEKNTIKVITNSIHKISETKATIDRALKLLEKTNTEFKQKYGRGTENIAQIHTFSIWYDEGAKEHPASLVDMDSNPGNIGITDEGTTSADDIDYFEDTAYKTGIELVANGTENTREKVEEKYREKDIEIIIRNSDLIEEKLIRSISGKVWDDSRTDTLGENGETQYIGDGLRDTDADIGERKNKNPLAKLNENVTKNYNHEENEEKTDIKVRNARVDLVEIVQIDDTHYYEEILSNVPWEQTQHKRTNADGYYELKGFIPGTYIVRFTYGDTVEENQVVETEEGVKKVQNDSEDGKGYNAELEAQKDMLVFNGQDYKSTQYTLWDELTDEEKKGAKEKSSTAQDAEKDTVKDADTIIRQLEKKYRSDARDDEIRRLEVNAFSEVMTNGIAEILKGVANGTDLTARSSKNTAQELKVLTDNTYMNAETMEFLVKAEKLTQPQTQEYIKTIRWNIKNGGASYNLSDAKKLYDDIYYQELEKIQNKDTISRQFKIENLDFGIEYRPETQISLVKEIDEAKIITEDGETLVDIFFYTTTADDPTDRVYSINEDPKKRIHHVDTERSKGLDLVQFVTNDYKGLLEPILSKGKTQGFAYIQIDDDILQGSKVEITYKFEAQNESEVDRITTNLNAIRYKENKLTKELMGKYTIPITEKNYTASMTARNVIYADIYAKDSYDTLYRSKRKISVSESTGDASDKTGYFGRFVGYAYYTGDLTGLDTISSIKFDKILDYVDTDLEYVQETDTTKLKDKLWAKTTAPELIDYVYLLRNYRKAKSLEGSDMKKPVVSYFDDTTTESVGGLEELFKVAETDGNIRLENVGGIEYTDLVVSVDDRVSDKDETLGGTSDGRAVVNNNDLSRFLVPKVTIKQEELSQNQKIHEEGNASMGIIYLPVSKVISAETDTKNMTYENIAEVIQLTVLTGRRTNFITTIGNVQTKNPEPDKRDPKPDDPSSGTPEFVEASYEPDTDSTETITLTPPTGLMRNRRVIVNTVEVAKKGVGATGIIAVIVAVILIVIKVIHSIIKKKRYK